MQSMDCTDIKVLLSGLIDDEVDRETRHVAERHIAGCDACRRLLDEAEALNELIVTDAETAAGAGLPDDLVGNVLSRTVHADQRRGPHGLTNWLGWLAAAAVLLLTLSLRLMDGPPAPAPKSTALAPVPQDPVAGNRSKVTEQSSVRQASFLQSSIYEGNVPPFLDAGASETPRMLREDAEAFDAASLVLEILIAADLDDADRLAEIREIATYDELLPRLTAARERLDEEADQVAVIAAESALLTVLQDPAAQRLQDLRRAVRQSDLHGQLSRLSARWDASNRI